jgi:hypothetical protein
MPQLLPHLLLRNEIGTSQTAIVLRNAGYIVTTVVDDDSAIRWAQARQVDGVVVELPAFRAVAFTRRLVETTRANLAVLAISAASDAIRRRVDVPVLHPAAVNDDLVSTIDILIATFERCGSAFQNSRDALAAGA